MTTKARHPPTPWTIRDSGEVIANVPIVDVLDAHKRVVLRGLYADKAAMIVRAVNSYQAMREALELAETLISKDIVRDDAGCLVKIKAALALAEKETP